MIAVVVFVVVDGITAAAIIVLNLDQFARRRFINNDISCMVSSLITSYIVSGSVPRRDNLDKCLLLQPRADQSLICGFG